MMSDEKKLFLLDAYALIFRAYYAFIRNPRYNSKGLNTSAPFGFTNTLIEVLKKEDPSHIAVVFDPSKPTFRKDIYKAYKANREETPEDIRKAVPYIKAIVEAFNIPIIEKEGFEADDVIGTLSRKAKEKGYTTYMMTPDKDFAQLVNDDVFMYKPKRSGNEAEVWGEKEVLARYKIERPEQMIDILALWGDSSDNVPGAPGVGEKTAQKLISQFGSIDKLYENIEELKGKLKENLIKHKDDIYLSKKLVTIVLDVPLTFDDEALKIKNANKKELVDIFKELEFKSLSERLFTDEKKKQEVQGTLFDFENEQNEKEQGEKVSYHDTIDQVKHNYKMVEGADEIKTLVDKLKNQKSFCFDTETTGLYPLVSELVGMSFSIKSHEAFYVPVPEDREAANKIVALFKPLFEDEKIEKTGQNIKYDLLMIGNYGVKAGGKLFDTMIAHYLIQPELPHNLDYLSEQYLDYTPVSVEKLIGKKGKNQKNMRSLKPADIADYACEDADLTLQLKNILLKRLEDNQLNELAETIEMPLVYVLGDMERAGVKINKDALEQYGVKLKNELAKLENKIIELSGGHKFNIASPKQLGEVLFDKMKIADKPKKTKSKQYSTSEETLEKLRGKHEIIDKILEYRSLKKLITGYVEALPKLINEKTNKIHTSFNQTITSTGRLSSNNPNLQNIPIREERGREIRKAFVASDNDHVLLAADYSQIELRLMAHISEDEEMIKAFQNNEDIHTATAAKIFSVNNNEVDKEMRRQAKTANFGIIYGISPYGLSQRLNIKREEAEQLIKGYFNNYPKIREYMDERISYAREKGYVQTIMGRRRYLKDINSANAVVRGFAERNAINAPVQGSAADIIKLAMIRIHEKMAAENYKSNMILQVHDELVFDVYRPEAEKLEQMVKSIMENVVELEIPLTVDTGMGDNWLEAH